MGAVGDPTGPHLVGLGGGLQPAVAGLGELGQERVRVGRGGAAL